MLKVSVVVPVYNPGQYIHRCVESILAQSLPADEYEAIFVDDGSTDGTSTFLDDVARQHDHIRVFHQPNSGWAGQPRNAGIDEARGEYIFFCDSDDWLGTEALQRLYDFALLGDADIVIGKMAGIGRGVPHELFLTTRGPVPLADHPQIMDSLTCHALLRRSFIANHGLRFAEHRRRLEDHLFMTGAYLDTERIAVYGDYTCYYHIRREDEKSLAFQQMDWPSYYRDLEDAVRLVLERMEPGPQRDQVLKRWLRVEVVGRATGSGFLDLEPADKDLVFTAASGTASRCFSEDVANLLPLAQRGTAVALIRGERERVEDLVGYQDQARIEARPTDVRWAGPHLLVSGAARLLGPATSADAAFDARKVAGPDVSDEVLEAGLERTRLRLNFRSTDLGVVWTAPATTVRLGGVIAFTASVDPGTLAAGRPLADGQWNVLVELSVLGIQRRTNLVVVPGLGIRIPALRKPRADQPDMAYFATKKKRGLALDVGLHQHPGLRRRTLRSAADPEALSARPPTPPHLGRRGSSVRRRLRRMLGYGARP